MRGHFSSFLIIAVYARGPALLKLKTRRSPSMLSVSRANFDVSKGAPVVDRARHFF